MRLLRIAFALAFALLLSSCDGRATTDTAGTSDSTGQSRSNRARGGSTGARGEHGADDSGEAVPVVTTRVIAKAEAVTVSAVGTVESISTVQIHSQVNGQVTGIEFKEGDEVKQGQLMFTIDQRPFQAALEQAEATLERDTATARNNQAERGRFDDLYKRGILPLDQYETQSAAADAAKATVDVDKAAVESARLSLQYTRITAPISGRTGSLGVHIGDITHTTDATPMVVINQMSPIYVTFSVPGRYLADIRRYQAQKPLTVRSQSQPNALPGAQKLAPPIDTPDVQSDPAGAIETGHVVFIDNAVDPATGTIKLRGQFENADRGLWPGLFEQVTLDLTTEPNALVVPATTVQVSQSGQYVYVVKNDCTAEMRPVTIERQQGNDIVIAKGVTQNDEVVTDGTLRLTPGARVSTENGRCAAGAE
jgi:multidrug efflux system membrane fusion protein